MPHNRKPGKQKKGSQTPTNSTVSTMVTEHEKAVTSTLVKLNALIERLQYFKERPKAKRENLETLNNDYLEIMEKLPPTATSSEIIKSKSTAKELRAELVARLAAMPPAKPAVAQSTSIASDDGLVAAAAASGGAELSEEGKTPKTRLDEQFTPALEALEKQMKGLESRKLDALTSDQPYSKAELTEALEVVRNLFNKLKAAADTFVLDGNGSQFTETVNALTSDTKTREVLEHPRGYWSFTAILNKIAAAVASVVGVKLDRNTFFRIHTTTERRVDAIDDAVKTMFPDL